VQCGLNNIGSKIAQGESTISTTSTYIFELSPITKNIYIGLNESISYKYKVSTSTPSGTQLPFNLKFVVYSGVQPEINFTVQVH